MKHTIKNKFRNQFLMRKQLWTFWILFFCFVREAIGETLTSSSDASPSSHNNKSLDGIEPFQVTYKEAGTEPTRSGTFQATQN